MFVIQCHSLMLHSVKTSSLCHWITPSATKNAVLDFRIQRRRWHRGTTLIAADETAASQPVTADPGPPYSFQEGISQMRFFRSVAAGLSLCSGSLMGW